MGIEGEKKEEVRGKRTVKEEIRRKGGVEREKR